MALQRTFAGMLCFRSPGFSSVEEIVLLLQDSKRFSSLFLRELKEMVRLTNGTNLFFCRGTRDIAFL